MVLAGDGGATAARRPLVARLAHVGEVAAAGALEEVAAHGGHVAQLPGGTGQHRLGQRRVAAAHLGVRGEVAVGDGGADAQSALGRDLDAVQGEFADVDEVGGAFDAGLHQVDEVGAAAEEAGVGVGGEQGQRSGDVTGAPVAELPHAVVSFAFPSVAPACSPAARATAWRMET